MWVRSRPRSNTYSRDKTRTGNLEISLHSKKGKSRRECWGKLINLSVMSNMSKGLWLLIVSTVRRSSIESETRWNFNFKLTILKNFWLMIRLWRVFDVLYPSNRQVWRDIKAYWKNDSNLCQYVFIFQYLFNLYKKVLI